MEKDDLSDFSLSSLLSNLFSPLFSPRYGSDCGGGEVYGLLEPDPTHPVRDGEHGTRFRQLGSNKIGGAYPNYGR